MEIDEKSPIYFTRSNLKLVLGTNRRTLDYRINALIKKKVLASLKRGFYLNLERYRQSSNKKELLEYTGQIMVYPSYLSGEWLLSQRGFLSETVYAMTFITTKKTRRFVTNQGTFIYRNIKEDLFFGFEEKSVDDFVYKVATPAKALFDMIYLSLKNNKISEEYLLNSRFNWDSIDSKDKKDFKTIVARSNAKKMIEVAGLLQKKGLL